MCELFHQRPIDWNNNTIIISPKHAGIILKFYLQYLDV